MKLLVTGGAGFIGSNYVRWVLSNTSDEVTVYDALTYAGNTSSLRDVQRDATVGGTASCTPTSVTFAALEDVNDRPRCRGALSRQKAMSTVRSPARRASRKTIAWARTSSCTPLGGPGWSELSTFRPTRCTVQSSKAPPPRLTRWSRVSRIPPRKPGRTLIALVVLHHIWPARGGYAGRRHFGPWRFPRK